MRQSGPGLSQEYAVQGMHWVFAQEYARCIGRNTCCEQPCSVEPELHKYVPTSVRRTAQVGNAVIVDFCHHVFPLKSRFRRTLLIKLKLYLPEMVQQPNSFHGQTVTTRKQVKIQSQHLLGVFPNAVAVFAVSCCTTHF